MIKLPFIILKSKNPNKKNDPVLFTSGGPGNSSLGWINGIDKSSFINDRDCIAFEQRGTRFAIPYLRLFVLDSVMKEAYRKNLPKDSMWLIGVNLYKKRLLQKGVDITGYNSDETVSDISDFLSVLKIDSVNLYGGSYSGGLMMAVLQKNPTRVRSLLLDSALPTFVPIDEDEPVNFNEALDVLFHRVEKDSLNNPTYENLKEKFSNYFTSISNKKFYLPYYDSITNKMLNIEYGKNELLDIIVNNMGSYASIKTLPFIMTDIIKGNHPVYLKPKMDRFFRANTAPDGMRMTVSCADQANYNRQNVMKQVNKLYPYMEGYHINDVWKEVCNCWKVPPVDVNTKTPFYSTVPVLTGNGAFDPACRPMYMKLIKHYLPNTQAFLFMNRSHGVGGKVFFEMAQQFLDDPFKKIISTDANIVEY
ncbi:MAG: alpha/beta fold hydrolase [Ferruginibacter sp.]